MSRSDQVGLNAPRQGTMLRQNSGGKVVNTVKAIERFAPPEFLTNVQRSLWIAALSDVELEFFRARHIPLLIQYVRAIELMMDASKEVMMFPENKKKVTMWMRYISIVTRLERFMSFDTTSLIAMHTRARAERRLGVEQDNLDDMADREDNGRRGLTYVQS